MRRARIEAKDARPGLRYRSLGGRVVVVYERKRLGKKHPDCPAPGWVPYRSPGSARARDAIKRVSLKGWIPPNYPLLED